MGICHVDDDQQVLIFDGAELIRSCPMSSSSEAEGQDKKRRPMTRTFMSLVDDQLIGLMVEKLILLLPGRLGQVHQFANSNARTSPLITVNYEDDIKSYSIPDSVNWATLKESRDFFRQHIRPIVSS